MRRGEGWWWGLSDSDMDSKYWGGSRTCSLLFIDIFPNLLRLGLLCWLVHLPTFPSLSRYNPAFCSHFCFAPL